MDLKEYWQGIHHTKGSTQVSWYQQSPTLSLQYIKNTGIDKKAEIIDVGAGASTLVDYLLEDSFQNITVLDISGEALEISKMRLGKQAELVNWLVADITKVKLPHFQFDVWHDRAVFHFLTNPQDRESYVNIVNHAVKLGGHVIVATFADDGPEKCSGLQVARYNSESLHDEFGNNFDLIDSTNEIHQTPFGTEQKFVYCYCRKS
jgi:2-polyprenyl-3-methyl-5-hydroxy-6-metoxy-1,4-benzoquinol methylase